MLISAYVCIVCAIFSFSGMKIVLTMEKDCFKIIAIDPSCNNLNILKWIDNILFVNWWQFLELSLLHSQTPNLFFNSSEFNLDFTSRRHCQVILPQNVRLASKREECVMLLQY